jgi:hypothetical protein
MRRVWVWLATGSAIAIGGCGGSDDSVSFSNTGGSGGSSTGGSDTGGANTGGANTGGTAGANTGGANTGGANTGGANTGGANTGGAAGAGTGGASTGGTGGAVGYTLDNVCQTLTPKLCAARQGCCTNAFGYNQAQCEANQLAECTARVAEVNGGKRKFTPSAIDPCLAAVATLYGACYYSGDQLAGYDLAVNVCNSIFDPVNAGPGTGCTLTSDCTSNTAANGFVGCRNGMCYQGLVQPAGGDCTGSNVCAPGLYCQPYPNNTCSQATAVGGNCYSSPQCGLGYYCDNGHCAKALPGGSSCYSDQWCLSVNCSNSFPGSCADQSPYVSQSQCGK